MIGSLALTSGSGGPASTRAGDKYLQGELSASLPLGQASSLSAGVRAAFVSRPLSGQPARQWTAFLGYTAQLPQLR